MGIQGTSRADGSQTPQRAKVVYLLGTGHSGSTLTAFLMDSHPQVASVGQTSVKPKIRRANRAARMICSCGRSVSCCDFWNEVFRVVRVQGIEMGPGSWANDYRYDSAILHRLLTRATSSVIFSRLQELAGYWLPWHSSRMARVDRVNVAFVRAVLDAKGAEVFVDTSKSRIRFKRLFSLPQFDVKVLHLVRDPRGLAASARRRGIPFEHAAEHWRNTHASILRLRKMLPPDRSMLLRYEDLCRDPREVLKRVFHFSGVAEIEGPVVIEPRRHHILGNAMRLADRIEVRFDERWRTSLTEAEQRLVLALAGGPCTELGYA